MLRNLGVMEQLQLEKPRLSASGTPSLGGKGCMLTFTGIAIFVYSLFLGACEGSRTDRMIKATERAVDDYNNGDSSSLIMLIIGVIVLGIIWVIGKAIDKKK